MNRPTSNRLQYTTAPILLAILLGLALMGSVGNAHALHWVTEEAVLPVEIPPPASRHVPAGSAGGGCCTCPLDAMDSTGALGISHFDRPVLLLAPRPSGLGDFLMSHFRAQ